jgi:hypothetical protein
MIAIVISILLFFMPESPRWLFSHDRDEQAVQVLTCLRSASGDRRVVEAEAEEIRAAIMFENSAQRVWLGLFKEDNVRSRWRVARAGVSLSPSVCSLCSRSAAVLSSHTIRP